MNTNIVNYRITNGSIVRVLLWLGLAYCIFFFRELLLTLTVGLVIASAIDPVAKLMSKYKIPRAVTVAAVFIVIFGLIAIGVSFVLPSLADDLARLIARLPELLDQVRVFGRDLGFRDASVYIGELSKNISKGQIIEVAKGFVSPTVGVVNTTGAVIGNIFNFLLMLVFSFYLAVQENGINNFLRLVTPKFYEKYVIDLWARSEKKIGSWAKGQIFVGLIIGVLVYIPLLIVGMPYATLFAILAFLGELVPVVGILLAAIPGVITAYLTQDLTFALIVAAIFFVISQLESYVIYPNVMNSVIGVPSIIILISFVVGAQVAGFWGVVLAVPLAGVAMELVNDIMQEKIPSRDLNRDVIRYE
jgi:predicted PurR-regulated permease PerM